MCSLQHYLRRYCISSLHLGKLLHCQSYLPGGGLTGWWYTGMLKTFRVLFVIFGISTGGFPFQTQCAKFANLDAFWKIWSKKHPICSKFCGFLQQFGIVMGPKITLYTRYRDGRNSEIYFEYPRTYFWSPPSRLPILLYKKPNSWFLRGCMSLTRHRSQTLGDVGSLFSINV